MWRPDNWKNPYFLKDLDGGYYNQYPEFAIYEAGADAILQALKERPETMFIIGARAGADPSLLKFGIENKRGWLVFVPEDKKASSKT